MKNKKLEQKICDEIMTHIQSRKTLQLATLDESGSPFASYAPFAIHDDKLVVLLSDIALHGNNLKHHPQASVLVIEDEDSARELFARLRVFYQVTAEAIHDNDPRWSQGIDALVQRHGDRANNLSQLSDFTLFFLTPKHGRYVKGFGKAYQFSGASLSGGEVNHLREGHKKKEATAA